MDIAPIADLYKSEVWDLGKSLGVDSRIIEAKPTDGLWDDGRTDEDQLGATYSELEEAMETGKGTGLKEYARMNSHKMNPRMNDSTDDARRMNPGITNIHMMRRKKNENWFD